MLRCLEEEQRECPAFTAPTPHLEAAETATKRLNQGYSSLLASGISARPSLALFSSASTNSSTPNASTLSPVLPTEPSFGTLKATQPPMPAELLPTIRPSPSTDALNMATVELEHQKFTEEPVIPATEMDGLSPADYWLVSTLHADFLRARE